MEHLSTPYDQLVPDMKIIDDMAKSISLDPTPSGKKKWIPAKVTNFFTYLLIT